MSVLLLDTSAVSILFQPDHVLHQRSFEIVAGHQWFISFLTRGELLPWPEVNRWGSARREELNRHIDLCTTLFADEATCVIWASIVAQSRIAGGRSQQPMRGSPRRPVEWDLPLVTADHRDFEHLDALTLIPLTP